MAETHPVQGTIVFSHIGLFAYSCSQLRELWFINSIEYAAVQAHVQAHVALLLRETGDGECVNHDNAPDSRM